MWVDAHLDPPPRGVEGSGFLIGFKAAQPSNIKPSRCNLQFKSSEKRRPGSVALSVWVNP